MFIDKILFSLLIVCFITTTAYSQSIEEETDSLLNIINQESTPDTSKAIYYNKIAVKHLFSQPKVCIDYARQALELSKKVDYFDGVFNAYRNLFNGHYFHGSHADSCLKYVQSHEQFIEEKGEEKEMITIHWNYAIYYGKISQIDKAIESYIAALELVRKYEESKDDEARLLNNIGMALSSNGNNKEAIHYYKDALKLVEDKTAKANMLSNLGLIYSSDLNKPDTAQIYYEQALVLYKSSNNDGGIADILIKKAVYLDKKKEFKKAYQFYDEAIKLIEENDIGYLYSLLYDALSNHYLLKEQYNLAIEYGEKALEDSKSQNDFTYISQVYSTLDRAYSAVGNYKKAHYIRGELMTFNDSINDASLMAKVEELETQFSVEQKEVENKLLKADAIATQKTIQSRTVMTIALLLGLLLIGSWAIVVYRNNRQKQELNQKLESIVVKRTSELQKANKNLEQANYELKTFNYIASHDIKEPIRTIGSYAGLIFRKLPENIKRDFAEDFTTIKKSTTQLYTLIEDFYRYTELSKGEDIEKQAVDLNLIKENIELSLNNIIKSKNGQITSDKLPTLNTNSTFIYTILKNIIENGLKFNKSETPIINLSVIETEKQHKIYIKDNGIGIDKAYQEQIFEMFKRLHIRHEYEGSGIGLAIVKLLADKINISIEIESEEGKGATFILTLDK